MNREPAKCHSVASVLVGPSTSSSDIREHLGEPVEESTLHIWSASQSTEYVGENVQIA